MQDFTLNTIQRNKNYTLGAKAHKAIATLNSLWYSDYRIAKLLRVQQSYVHKWKYYKEKSWSVPRYLSYIKLAKLAGLSIKYQDHEDHKKKVQQSYQRFLTSQMFTMLQDWSSPRGSPYQRDEWSPH